MQRNFVAACAGIGAELLKHRMNGLPWQAVLVRETARVGVHVPEPEARLLHNGLPEDSNVLEVVRRVRAQPWREMKHDESANAREQLRRIVGHVARAPVRCLCAHGRCARDVV